MFGRKAARSDSVDSLDELALTWREHADNLSRLEIALRRTHPETITTSDWTRIRRWYLESVARDFRIAHATADRLAAIARQLDEHRNSQGHR